MRLHYASKTHRPPTIVRSIGMLISEDGSSRNGSRPSTTRSASFPRSNREESKAVTAQKRLRFGPCFNREGCVVEGAGLNVVVMPPIEQKAAAQAARAVPAVQALAVQGVDSRGVFARRLAGVGAGRPERQRPAGGSWFPDAGASVRAWARNACGPLLGDTPCVQHNRRTPEPRASSTSGTNLFAFVAIAICAAARQITR